MNYTESIYISQTKPGFNRVKLVCSCGWTTDWDQRSFQIAEGENIPMDVIFDRFSHEHWTATYPPVFHLIQEMA